MMGDKLIKVILSIFGVLIVITLVVFVACCATSMDKQIKNCDEKIEELDKKLNEKIKDEEQEDKESEKTEASEEASEKEEPEEVEAKTETYSEVKQAPAVSVPSYTPEPEPEAEYVPNGYYETRQMAYQAALPYMNDELNCITGFEEYVSNYGKTYYTAILQYCEPPVFGTEAAEEPENPGNEENG